MSLKVDILYDNDLDGIAAAHGAWKWCEKEGMESNLAAIGHGDRNSGHKSLISEGSNIVVLLDWPSWEPERFFEVGEQKKLIVIDHHETILKWLRDPESVGRCFHEGSEDRYSGIVTGPGEGKKSGFDLHLDLNRSAAPLAWKYFHDSEVPPLHEIIEDRDLWKWEIPGSEEVLLGLQTDEVTVERIEKWAFDPDELRKRGTVIRSYQEKLLEDYAKHLTVARLWVGGEGPYKTGLISLPHLRSEMADTILQSRDDLDLAIIYNHTGIGGEKEVICSIRSRPDSQKVHVGDLCSRLGGGGHPSAGGCKISPTAISFKAPESTEETSEERAPEERAPEEKLATVEIDPESV